MFKKGTFIFFCVCLFLSINGFTQNHEIDSLKKVAFSATKDTVRFNALMSIGNLHQGNQNDTAVYFHLKGAKLANNKQLFLQKGQALRAVGVDYYYDGNYDTCLYYFSEALLSADKAFSVTKDSTMLYRINFLKASILGNIGSTYYAQSDFAKSLTYYYQALALSELMKNKRLQAFNLSNIGVVYSDINDDKKALSHYLRALAINKDLGNKKAQSINLGNIGIIYSSFGDSALFKEKSLSLAKGYFQQALFYLNASQTIDEEMNNVSGQAANLINIGNVYKALADYDRALHYYERSITLCEQIEDRTNMQSALADVGIILLRKGNYGEAEIYLQKSLKLANELGSLQRRYNAHYYLSSLYENKKDVTNAFNHYKLYVALRDSFSSEENTKKIIEQELRFNFQKKATADSVKVDGEKKIVAAQLKQEKTRRFALYGGLIMVVLFAAFFYNRFQVTRKQKKIIEEKEKETKKQNDIISYQKHLVEEKQNEIIESITYAKRLQEAILPSQSFINHFIPRNFVLYKPKDLVAGDFYWAEEINGLFFIAAADSTGHGVPGAMVSVVCSNALNRTVKEFNVTETGKILDKTRELVLETFAKGGNEVKDGMDVSLLCIDPKNKQVYWSGANNSLLYVSNGTLHEIKADKQPIGKTEFPKPFTTHRLACQENTSFYLYTDGFADQFGGPKGKKFKHKQFADLLLSVSDKSPSEQMQIINHAFETWKSNLEQVDDVCVIGIKI